MCIFHLLKSISFPHSSARLAVLWIKFQYIWPSMDPLVGLSVHDPVPHCFNYSGYTMSSYLVSQFPLFCSYTEENFFFCSLYTLKPVQVPWQTAGNSIKVVLDWGVIGLRSHCNLNQLERDFCQKLDSAGIWKKKKSTRNSPIYLGDLWSFILIVPTLLPTIFARERQVGRETENQDIYWKW